MTLRNAFEDMATEATLDDVLKVLMWILDKLPRTDQLDRAIVSLNDTGGSTVTVSNASLLVSGVQTLGAASRPADAMHLHAAQAGAMHIYNNIIVS